ncbi:hypothetical protein [Streptosporangium canum]|uniref:hypothetical protein n=1 Tax=Streptosporangium canum TaxID=324952 RepID=UPI003797598E
MWNRLTAFDPADLDVAFAGRGPGAPRVMRRCPPQAAVVRAAPRSPRPAAGPQVGAVAVANDSTEPWTGVPELLRSGRSRAASTNDRRIANPCPERGRAHPWSWRPISLGGHIRRCRERS